MTIPADPLYQHLQLTAEKRFWRCVETGEAPHLFGIEPPRLRVEAVRIVDELDARAIPPLQAITIVIKNWVRLANHANVTHLQLVYLSLFYFR
jgi:hypothetical protein